MILKGEIEPSGARGTRSENFLDSDFWPPPSHHTPSQNGTKDTTDMEKDQIFPRTRFVKNQDFRKKYISKFITITRIIMEIIIYRL